MDRVMDLDEAAAALTGRLPAWRAAGLTCAPSAWRDRASPWPLQPMRTAADFVALPDGCAAAASGHRGLLP
ncbi:hypothetical protein [Streptomyces sp. NPDC048560]|uniref:hypothetical protein n=1 Tax=Streptomyces sp. NPDC048560 TaxID=3155488 RepID=UPI00342AA7CF